jgi:hypothetical protein
VNAAQADLRKAGNQIALQVRQVCIEILIRRLEMQAMALQVSASEQSLKESADGVSTRPDREGGVRTRCRCFRAVHVSERRAVPGPQQRFGRSAETGDRIGVS